MFEERLTLECKAVLQNIVYKFMSHLDKSRNTLIIAVLGTDIRWKSRIRRQWVKSLYVHTDLDNVIILWVCFMFHMFFFYIILLTVVYEYLNLRMHHYMCICV